MENKIITYIKNFFNKLFNKIKTLFLKNNFKNKENSQELKQVVHPKITNNEKQNFAKLVLAFDNNKIEEKDLTQKEREQLKIYYENKNKELDMEIEKQRKILITLNQKINNNEKNSDEVEEE